MICPTSRLSISSSSKSLYFRFVEVQHELECKAFSEAPLFEEIARQQDCRAHAPQLPHSIEQPPPRARSSLSSSSSRCAVPLSSMLVTKKVAASLPPPSHAMQPTLAIRDITARLPRTLEQTMVDLTPLHAVKQSMVQINKESIACCPPIITLERTMAGRSPMTIVKQTTVGLPLVLITIKDTTAGRPSTPIEQSMAGHPPMAVLQQTKYGGPLSHHPHYQEDHGKPPSRAQDEAYFGGSALHAHPKHQAASDNGAAPSQYHALHNALRDIVRDELGASRASGVDQSKQALREVVREELSDLREDLRGDVQSLRWEVRESTSAI